MSNATSSGAYDDITASMFLVRIAATRPSITVGSRPRLSCGSSSPAVGWLAVRLHEPAVTSVMQRHDTAEERAQGRHDSPLCKWGAPSEPCATDTSCDGAGCTT